MVESVKISAENMDTSKSEAIPFITYEMSTQTFAIGTEAKQFLQSLSQYKKLGIIAVAGRYRTGKSYLMNKLFLDQDDYQTEKILATLEQPEDSQNSNTEGLFAKAHVPTSKGFTVGPTINPCTKGLWIWKDVFYVNQQNLNSSTLSTNQDNLNSSLRQTDSASTLRQTDSCNNEPMPVLIIDTEGLGAFSNADENHDSKIFLLALLLCSLLVYNSVGAIDENALNNLSLVVNLSKTLQVKAGQALEDADEVAAYFPSFVWVLRDFALQLRDSEGNEISQRQYLEQSMKDQRGTSDAIERKNRIRRLVRNFFRERDCVTLVRPAEDEAMLQRLNQCENSELRPEFKAQIDLLRTKLFKKVKAKKLNQCYVTGPGLIDLAQTYIAALNDGKVPTIQSAWQNIQKSNLETLLKESLQLFKSTQSTNVDDRRQKAKDNFKAGLQQQGHEQGDPIIEEFKNKFKVELAKLTLAYKEQIEREQQILARQLIDTYIAQEVKPHIQIGTESQYTVQHLQQSIRHLTEILEQENYPCNVTQPLLLNQIFTLTNQIQQNQIIEQTIASRLVTEKLALTEQSLQESQQKNKQNHKDSLQLQSDLTEEKAKNFQQIQVLQNEIDKLKYQTEAKQKANDEEVSKVKSLESQVSSLHSDIRKLTLQLETKETSLENEKSNSTLLQTLLQQQKTKNRQLKTQQSQNQRLLQVQRGSINPPEQNSNQQDDREEKEEEIRQISAIAYNGNFAAEIEDVKQSNAILRIYKQIYMSASLITCSHCGIQMRPVLYKAHLQTCGKDDQTIVRSKTGASHRSLVRSSNQHQNPQNQSDQIAQKYLMMMGQSVVNTTFDVCSASSNEEQQQQSYV